MKIPFAQDGELHLPRADSNAVERGLQYGTAVVREVTRTLGRRSESTCEPGNNSAICAKPTSSTSNTTLPIVLGAVIPITCAICVFVYLHRRNNKKQAIEDANDPHKSMDFGMEFAGGPQRPKRGFMGRRGGETPEMSHSNFGSNPNNRQLRGLSMDMMSNPYLLPAGLHGSRESLHSMSRTISHDQHDPYRPVTFVRSSTDTSRSPRPFNENASMYSASTIQTGNEKSGLVANASSMSHSFPKRGDSVPSTSSPNDDYSSPRELHSMNRSTTPSRKTSLNSSTPNLPEIIESSPPRKQTKKDSLPPLPPIPTEDAMEQVAPVRSTSQSTNTSLPPRKASLAAAALPPVRTSDSSYYGEQLPPPPPPPKVIEPFVSEPEEMDDIYAGRFSIDNSAPSQHVPIPQANNNRLSVMGMRPLPPNLPEEHPEQRANRIRSFYKEYFDESRPNPQNGFYEDWDPAYLDAAIYNPETGDYDYPAAPFAQPMGRRAMTPPPRGAYYSGGPDHARHYSTMSGGGPRGGPRGRPMAPKKKLPPPKALTSLPTPYMLREDTALIMNPIDFAPPTSFRETQNGRRPDSPMGIQRPYSPSVKAYSPLVPSFDELPVMPSPHHLRKSGAFTSLDFASLPRFRGQVDGGNASDAGSIRSARSGISAMQIDAVRAGAYRVSRIPKEFVTSRDDLSTQLKPRMNLISPA